MKIVIGLGTRPEAIKLVPLIFRLKDRFDFRVLSTGQHDVLLRQVLEFFKVQVDYDLACMHASPDLEELSENIFHAVGEVFTKENPDLLIIQGDTLSVYQTAFLAFLRKIPIFHIEAGLRTHRKYSPFPEEIFRTMVAKLADFHFAPTMKAKQNLLADGVREDRIMVTGNTVIDSQLMAEKMIDEKRIYEELSKYNIPLDKLADGRKNVLITVHRRENFGQPLKNICAAVQQLARTCSDLNFIWLVHENPGVKSTIYREMWNRSENIILAAAVSYDSLQYLMRGSYLIMTDSGGIQEEAPTFGKPVIVLRESTERPEIISNGNGLVVGDKISKRDIIDIFLRFYNDDDFYKSFSKKVNPFGDGKASERILRFLLLDEVKSFISNYPGSCDQCLQLHGIEEYI